jgi:tetratricopeptide (TPR) repeat protein
MGKIIITLSLLLFITKGYGQYEDVRYLVEEGNKYYKKKEYLKAEYRFKKVVKIDSFHLDSYFNLGAIYLEKKEYEKALFNFLKCIELGDTESFEILKENISFNYEVFNISNISSHKILYEIGLKFLEQNKLKKAEKYFLRAAKFGSIKSSEILKTEYQHNANDVTYYKLKDLDSYPFYIHEGKHYKISKWALKGLKKFFKKFEQLAIKDERYKYTSWNYNSDVYLNISSKGVLVPIFQNIPKETSDFISEILINNFKFIPGKINGKNVGTMVDIE